MPFRLLGLVPDPESLAGLAGLVFPRYAEQGVAVTVACTSGVESSELTHRARRLGIQALWLLDYRPAERASSDLVELLADVMRAVRPHVVVLSADDEAVRIAGSRAFAAARHAAGGTGALPAKLYLRVRSSALPTLVSTSVPVGIPALARAEAFQRVFPSPWVTGLVERDLFAGLALDRGQLAARPDHRLAS